MAYDDEKEEKRKQNVLKRFIPSGPPQNVSAVEEIAQRITGPIQQSQDFFKQQTRNLSANMYSDNVIGDVSEENLGRMQLASEGIQDPSAQMLDTTKISYEPAFMGGINALGRGAGAVAKIAPKVHPIIKSPLGLGDIHRVGLGEQGLGVVRDETMKQISKNPFLSKLSSRGLEAWKTITTSGADTDNLKNFLSNKTNSAEALEQLINKDPGLAPHLIKIKEDMLAFRKKK